MCTKNKINYRHYILCGALYPAVAKADPINISCS